MYCSHIYSNMHAPADFCNTGCLAQLHSMALLSWRRNLHILRSYQNWQRVTIMMYASSFTKKILPKNKNSVAAGFEPAREFPNGFQVHRLNHSAKQPADSKETLVGSKFKKYKPFILFLWLLMVDVHFRSTHFLKSVHTNVITSDKH